MVQCSRCGTIYEESAAYCPHWGATAPGVYSQPPQGYGQPPVPPQGPQGYPGQQGQPQQPPVYAPPPANP